jgi:hypothetical protein
VTSAGSLCVIKSSLKVLALDQRRFTVEYVGTLQRKRQSRLVVIAENLIRAEDTAVTPIGEIITFSV